MNFKISFKKTEKKFVLLPIISLICGCSIAPNIPNWTENSVKATRDVAIEKANSVKTVSQNKSFLISDAKYFSPKPLVASDLENDSEEKPSWLKTFNISYNTTSSEDLSETLSHLFRIAKDKNYQIYFEIDQDVLDFKQAASSAKAATSSSGGQSQSPSPAMMMLANNSDMSLPISPINFSGNLEDFLDLLADKVHLNWRYENNKIVFYKYETKIFKISAIDNDSKLSSSLSTSNDSAAGAGSAGGASTGGSTGTTSTSIDNKTEINLWKEVEETIKPLISVGGNIVISKNTGIISVKDTPKNLKVIEKQINELNAIFSKQIVLKVQIFSIETNGQDDKQMDLAKTFAQAGLTITGAKSASPVIAATPATFQFTANPNSRLNGVAGTMKLLSSLGTVALVTEGTLITLNGQPVPLNVVETRSYLKKITTTVPAAVGGVQAPTTSEPEIVGYTVGLSMSFLPKVVNGNQVVMKYSLDLKDQVGIDVIDLTNIPGGATYNLPIISVKNFMQNVSIKTNETLVLSGFQQNDARNYTNGVGNAGFWALGGGKQNTIKNKNLVILVTPTIVGY